MTFYEWILEVQKYADVDIETIKKHNGQEYYNHGTCPEDFAETLFQELDPY